MCLVGYKDRKKPSELLSWLNNELPVVQISKVQEPEKRTTMVQSESSNFLDQFKNALTKMTK
jgi:hypothetical protein